MNEKKRDIFWKYIDTISFPDYTIKTRGAGADMALIYKLEKNITYRCLKVRILIRIQLLK